MKKMKYILPLVMMLLSMVSMSAQKPDRDEWLRQMTEFRHDFLSKKLQLTEAQKTKFFALYDAMSRERHALRHDVRQAEKALKDKGTAATEADYEALNKKVLTLESKVSEVEMKYYKQFKTILSQKQISKLREAEEELTKIIRKAIQERKAGRK